VALVTLVVDPRTPTAAAEQAVLEALWRSRLEPLAGFRLDVQEPDGSYRAGVDPVRFAEIEDELVQRFGPRPVPER
jgi:ribosomal protein S12 methylthiotransferase accessory factor YcaO